MTVLGNGLSGAEHYEDALTVSEAQLATLLRLGSPERSVLVTQANLAGTYQMLGRKEQALRMLRDVYFGRVELHGEKHENTLRAASNYASSLIYLNGLR